MSGNMNAVGDSDKPWRGSVLDLTAVLVCGAVALVYILLAAVGHYFWAWVAGLFFGLVFVGRGAAYLKARRNRARKARRDEFYRATGLDRIDIMSGIEFEHFVAAVLRGAGYAVSATKATGDFGVDLIAVKNGLRTAVQCKRNARPIGVAAVQQAVAGAKLHRCSATMVVSNYAYTRAAQELALVNDCSLIDRIGLERLVANARHLQ